MGAADKLYNGNIAETFWSTATDGGFVRNYGYKYDQLNRLKDATYQKSNLVTNMYNEKLTYDKNGNIMTLKRNGDNDAQVGALAIDNLAYTYKTNSNSLLNVADGTNSTSGFNDFNKVGDDYSYDANGNLITDKNKKITAITYNHLNLPTKIVFGTTGSISYVYSGSGQKVEKMVTQGTTITTTNYLNGYLYKNALLQYFPTAEGYVEPNGSSYKYVYQYKDHLGNVRLSYTKNTTTNALDIIEENNYYPFGLRHAGYNTTIVGGVTEAQKVKFGSKELQDELGLNMYDYGSRMYDPARAGWSNIDPLTEKMRRWSPYNYCFNNPTRFTDPDGMAPNDIIVLGNSAGAKGVGHQAVLIGDDKKGWVYISKDGAAKSGGAYGESRWTAKVFKSVDEFKNSAHNFEVVNGTNHSKVGGGEASKMTFKLDENGNKIQRYDQAYRIKTDGKKDNEAIVSAMHKAGQDYSLTTSDCSDIPTTALNKLQDENGNKLKDGEADGLMSERPNAKQEQIESRNKGKDYDKNLVPTTTKLQKGEKGIIE